MKEGKFEGAPGPRKRTERVLSPTSDYDEHFLFAARALRPPRAYPARPRIPIRVSPPPSFRRLSILTKKSFPQRWRERERSRSPQLPSYRLERESTSAAAEGRREGRSEGAAAASAAATALLWASAATAPDRSRSIFGGKGSGPMDRRRRRGKAAASVRRGGRRRRWRQSVRSKCCLSVTNRANGRMNELS